MTDAEHLITMKPFNAHATCPKCGSQDIHTTFCQRKRYEWGGPCTPTEREREHLDRICRRCSYDWIEAPLDATQETR